MKRMRRIAFSVLLVSALVLTALPVCAADELLGTVVDGSLLTDETYAEGIAYPRQRGSLLSYGSGSVTIEGPRQVKVAGSTAAYKSVKKIQVAVHLQKLVSGSWQHVLTMGPKIKYSANYVAGSGTYSVSGGYYYRAYGAHTVTNGSTTEATTSFSNGVWVS